MTLAILTLAGLLFTASIGAAQSPPAIVPAPAISDDLDPESLRAAIRRSIAYLERIPGDRIVGEQPRRFTAKEILDTLKEFEKTLEHWHCRECWLRRVETHFEFVPSSNDPESSEILFTGYFQPVVEASPVATEKYRYPLYGRPADLITAEHVTLAPAMNVEKVMGRLEGEDFVPYYSRREIENFGPLRGRGYEIAWLKDPLDLFFLQIQGSGILRLPDGSQIHVSYAASNGRPYRSIGRLLIENGKIPKEEMSMQRLRRYLAEHPEEQSDIMAHNESYIFFRVVEQGPLGSLELPLTAGRSLATDSRLFPKGALAFVLTRQPVVDDAGRLVGWRPLSRFALNQDTGGAIRGLQRADIYFGSGDQAGAIAGIMNATGKLYFPILKDRPLRGPDRR